MATKLGRGLESVSIAKLLAKDGEDGALRHILCSADADFHARHPELKGAPLTAESPKELQAEWAEIYRENSRLALGQLRLDASILRGLA